jgi:hypothetical protein
VQGLDTIAGYYAEQSGPAPAVAAARPRRSVRSVMPAKSTLDYTNAAITALVLVLALPWLLRKLATNPAEVISAAGRKTVKG